MSVTTLRFLIHRNKKTYSLPIVLIGNQNIVKPLASYLEYALAHKNKSKSWHNQSSQAIALLVEFISTQEPKYDTKEKLFEAFVEALEFGTLSLYKNEIVDKSGLNWKRRKKENASKLLGHINSFTDWIYDEVLIANYGDIKSTKNLLVNPKVQADHTNRLLNIAAYHNRNSHAFLKHLNEVPPTEIIEFMRKHRIEKDKTTEEYYPFSEDLMRFTGGQLPLFIKAFNLRNAKDYSPIHEKLNLRNVLIVWLMHFGGLRTSECFHLFLSDIVIDKKTNKQSLTFTHPELGIPPKSVKGYVDRKDYLMKKYALHPRNNSSLAGSKLFAGWKGAWLDSELKDEVHFFPVEAGDIFFKLLKIYVATQRVHSDEHPFLFTNLKGEPFDINSFKKEHKRAFQSLGLDIEYKLENGTTPHCHRHSYGTRCYKAGLDDLTIQRMMHHKNIKSQEKYKHLTKSEIQAELKTKGFKPATTKIQELEAYSNET